MALECLHSLRYVYRDLKPENVLIDINGHVKLTDFGLCKKKSGMGDRLESFCGSPEYMAPEMLSGEGHTFTIDYYCLGALLYELLTGFPPYFSNNKAEMYNNILKNSDLKFP